MTPATATTIEAEHQLGFDLPATAFALDVRYVPHDSIVPDPDQPRQEADDVLRASIARTGILQPITVRPHPTTPGLWMIVDGERRWRGSAGVQGLIPVLVREDQEEPAARLRTQLVANTGEPLRPVEEARAFAQLLQLTGLSQAELADSLGRAKSTVNDRLALLDLGPWLDLIETGLLPVSHAVRVLVPFRTMPDAVHAKAIAKVEKDYRWQHKGGGQGISLGDFANLIGQVYRPFFYPLAKSKTTYNKQPEFSTKDHDRECDCGGIKVAIAGDTLRLCCGNPAYWQPRHRKAMAAKPKDQASPRDARPVTVVAPPGTPVISLGYNAPPSNVVALTNGSSWRVEPHRIDDAFDPKDLEIDDAQLVVLRGAYGTDAIGTKDLAAVKRARAAWQERWSNIRAGIRVELQEALQKHTRMFPTRGEGLRQLVQLIAPNYPLAVLDLAEALGIEIPAAAKKAQPHERGGKVRPWIAKMADVDVQRLADALATVQGRNLATTSEELAAMQLEAVQSIQKRVLPWAPPKAAAKRGKKTAGRAVPLDVEETDADVESDVDEVENDEEELSPSTWDDDDDEALAAGEEEDEDA